MSNLTLEMIEEASRKLCVFNNHKSISNLFIEGMRVIEAPQEPQKIKLSDSVMVSLEYRREFDDWLLTRFGRKESMIKRGEAWYSHQHGCMVINKEDMALFLSDVSA